VEEAGRNAHRRWGTAFVVLGSVVALLLVDLAVGSLVRSWWSPEQAEVVVDTVNFSGSADTVEDPRVDLPAMADSPWADAYFRELQRTPASYWPFTQSRPQAFDGEFINIDGWARVSYVSPDAGEDAPVVWMFGGSTTWGEGQRDEYTIASYLSRIAEAEGLPIVVQNYGQRGWTHFQEMILFEQLSAEGPVPDVAIFYDGANEINAQSLSVTGVPSHVLVDQYAELISGGVAEEFQEPDPEPGVWSVAWNAYVDASAVHRVVRELDARLVADVGARTAGGTDVYVTTIEDAERAVDVYERGRSLTISLAERAGVEPVFLWQPLVPNRAEVWAADHVSEPTTDLSEILAGYPEVFVDGAHTNERGAELVSREIWARIRPSVEAAAGEQRSNPRSSGSGQGSTTTTLQAPPSSAEAIAGATAALDSASGDACQVERWKVWLGTLRAADANEAAEIGQLTRRFLTELADAAPATLATETRVVRDAAATFPADARSAVTDPNRPLVPQLSAVSDESSPFLVAFQSVSTAVASVCTAPGGVPGGG